MNDQPSPTLDPTPVVTQPEPEKTLVSWEAPARLYKKRNHEFYTTILALVFLLSVILLFAKEFLLIGVIFSFGFLAYVLASVEPETVTHSLTNKGIRSYDKFVSWDECLQYWWEEKWNQQLLHILTPNRFPRSIILLVGSGDKDQINKVVANYIINQKPDPSFVDKAASWIQEKVPLETSDAPPASPSSTQS